MTFDLLIVGGGVNGAGIARDAAGRGLSVLLVEQDDLAAHTSSASTKLVHGGLRYLEQYAFRLVRESLVERERLLGIAPHIIRPLAFVLPHAHATRPRWVIRLGLWLYDHLGGRKALPASFAVRLDGRPYGAGLKPGIARGFVYSDCWVDDARLVTLNAVDAVARGAEIRTRTRFLTARRENGGWRATIAQDGAETAVAARAIVNAGGPWVDAVLGMAPDAAAARPARLVKGSHIVVPRLFDGDHAYILQNPDRRIVFAIPYEGAFTLIGTTDVAWSGDPSAPRIGADETAYLCESVNRYFVDAIAPADIVHSYAGIRSLYDDGEGNASDVTRDYVLRLDAANGAPLLSVYGGKITTYRRLAEHALEKLARFLAMGPAWTDGPALPGGDIGDFAAFLASVRARWPFLEEANALRMARAYGTRLPGILGDAATVADLGEVFGGGLTAREVDHLVAAEFARTPEDILWRRTKAGLHGDAAAAARLADYLARR